MHLQVSFEVNVTLSGGMNLTPFMSTQKEALLTPINQMLGDHGTANITAADDNNGTVRAYPPTPFSKQPPVRCPAELSTPCKYPCQLILASCAVWYRRKISED